MADYWKGEVFAYVGLPQNLKDLKDGVVGVTLQSHGVVGVTLHMSRARVPGGLRWLS